MVVVPHSTVVAAGVATGVRPAGDGEGMGLVATTPEHDTTTIETTAPTTARMTEVPQELTSGSQCDQAQTAEVVLPAVAMDAALALVGEPEMPKGQDGAPPVWCQGDFDGGRAGWDCRVALPTPGHTQPAGRIDFLVLAAGDVLAVDVDPITAAG